MNHTLVALLVAALLPTLGTAQTPASATVRVGCTNPAPTGSLKPAAVSPVVWIPDANGKINIEFESVQPFGGWRLESANAGYRGSGYFRWAGSNHFHQPGVDTITFRFQIQNAGSHIIRLHNRHDDPDPSGSNDCWVRLDGGTWEKWVDNWGPSGVGVWSFNAFLESTGAFLMPNLSAGMHTLEISGRSTNFKLDSVHVLPQSVWFANTTDPAAQPLRQRPLLGQSFTVRMGDPTNAAGLTPGLAQAQWFASFGQPTGYPCGTVFPFGEALLSLSSKLFKTPPATWAGPGQSVPFTTVLPNDTSLLGLFVGTQGLLFEPGKLVLTDAVDLVLGDV